jgi:hypothetical protein
LSHLRAYGVSILRHMDLSQSGDRIRRNGDRTTKTIMDTTLSRSYVTLKLSEIQKRCEELMQEPEGLTELRLEDPETVRDNGDPYNHA